ncbi:glutathione hydrolase 1-like isoform X2 [Phragmites australis]|uniref:glutathione hydrolase 1-like isoform X2 n=1 Tax=Phragmites australis TaxID=29695 RepID=UPI002D76D3FC|nr:glutathione hydrolase 1-like isoform X2 [Phragmites australis]
MAARRPQWAPATTALLLFLLLAAGAAAGERREVVTSPRGAVAADDGRCSRIGRDALRDGGSAVDAAVSTALCLGVVSPASSGVGGGAFMLVRLDDGTAVAYDARETAPLAASKDMYGGNETLKAKGALSIAVPGEIAGLYEAWKRHGKLPWKRLVMPASRLALAFRISPYLRMQMEATRDGILGNRGIRAVYAPDGDILKVGDVCRNVELARTLRAVAEHGPSAFYHGSVGAQLVKDVREAGGIITMEDLNKYQVKVRRPLSESVMGLQVVTMPPPSAGGAGMMLVLNILSQYGIPSGFSGSLGIHRLIESFKHYFAVKMNLADPDFVNVSEVVSDMMSPKFAAELKKTIYDNMTFDPKHYGGRWNILQDHGTSHLSIVDSERNAVSMTSTVNSYFGSLILSPSTGILLNNEMDDFSMPANTSANSPPPAPANFVSPLKRPLSSMAPTIVLKDGKLKAAVGASGGSMIPAATIEVFLNHFVKSMDPLSSVMAPRVYHQLIPNVVQYENWTTVIGDHFELDAATRADLQKRGHVLKPLAGGTISQFVVHNVEHYGDLTAVSDPRKGGFPAGY